MKKIEKLISPFIETQFPSFYREEGNQFISFIKAYYEWMEQTNNPLWYSRNLPELRDIDTTVDEFIVYFKEKYLKNIQFDTASNKQLLVKNSLELYRSKGTERSIDLFFKLVYGTSAEVKYPGENILRLSDGVWERPEYLEITYSKYNVDYVGKQVIGSRSGATAFVEKYIRRRAGYGYVNMLYISGRQGEFQKGEVIGISVNSKPVYDIAKRAVLMGSVDQVILQDKGRNFEIGDIVNFQDSTRGSGGIARVTGVSDATGIIDFIFLEGGYGYTLNAESIVSEKVLTIENVQPLANSGQYFRLFEAVSQPIVNATFTAATGDLQLDDFVYSYHANGAISSSGVVVNVAQIGTSGDVMLAPLQTGPFANNRTYYTAGNTISLNFNDIEDRSITATAMGLPNTYVLTLSNISGAFLKGQHVYQANSTKKYARGLINLIEGGRVTVTEATGLFKMSEGLYNEDSVSFSANISNIETTLGVYNINKSIHRLNYTLANNAGIASSPYIYQYNDLNENTAKGLVLTSSYDSGSGNLTIIPLGGYFEDTQQIYSVGNTAGATLFAYSITTDGGDFVNSDRTSIFGLVSNTNADLMSVSLGSGAEFNVGTIGETEVIFIGTDIISANNKTTLNYSRIGTTVGSNTGLGIGKYVYQDVNKIAFNPNTNINTTTGFIALPSASSKFPAGDIVKYDVAAGNTVINNMVANDHYYVAFSNSSGLILSYPYNKYVRLNTANYPNFANNILSNSTPTPPSLDLNFIDATSIDSRITFSRGSQATYFDSTGTLRFAPNNLIRNNTMVGTVAGTPGTLPTNWNRDPSSTGLSSEVVGSGTDGGISYVDFRVFGTAAATSFYAVYFESSSQIVASNGETWTNSVYLKLAGGSTSGLSALPSACINENTAAGAYITGQEGTQITPNSTWQRTSLTRTLSGGATVARVLPFVLFRVNSGAAINITLRIGFPQMERGSTATTVNPTSTSAYYGPRLDYNPSTLAAQGLLIEEQRTNSIRNNTMQGAVAGTPGTLPTNWFVYTPATGLTTSVVGTGTDNGISYIDVRVTGTASGGGNIIWGCEPNTGIAALNGQTWAQSTYLKIQGGTTTGIVDFRIQNDERSASAYIRSNTSSALPLTTAALNTQRYSFAATLSGGGTVAYIVPYVLINFTVGVAIDITLRIGLPQLEQGAFATSVIPTTTTALTRNADVASMTGTNFSSWYNASEGTVFCQGIGVNNVAVGTRRYFEINNNTPDERLLAGYGFTTACRYLVSDGGATQADIGVTTTTGGALVKFAGAYKTNDFQQASNGTLGTADTSGTLPTVDRMFIGQAETTAAATMLNGYIQRISYYPVRLPNSTLQALTTAGDTQHYLYKVAYGTVYSSATTSVGIKSIFNNFGVTSNGVASGTYSNTNLISFTTPTNNTAISAIGATTTISTANQIFYTLSPRAAAFGFPKNPQGDIKDTIYSCLSFDRFEIGVISSLSGVDPGADYNIDPYVLAYEKNIAAFNRKDFLIKITDATSQFVVGEKINQVLGSLKYYDLKVSSGVFGNTYNEVSVALNSKDEVVSSANAIYIPSNTVSFNTSTDIDNDANTVTIEGNPFAANDLVRYYTTTGNTALSGLSNNTFYYVKTVSGNSITLSATAGGANINIDGTNTVFFHSNTDVNSSGDFISIPNADTKFGNGNRVKYYTGQSNVVVTGLSNNNIYYVVAANSTGLALSVTSGGANINITGLNPGSNGHYLKYYNENFSGHFLRNYSNPYGDNTRLLYTTATGNTVISGLTNATAYYVVSSNSVAVKLSTSLGGSPVDLTAAGSEETGHYLATIPGYLPKDKVYQNVTKTFNASSGVDDVNDAILIPNNPYANGDAILYYTGVGGTVLTNLANNTTYYVVQANSTALKLSTSVGGSVIAIAPGVSETHNLKTVANASVYAVYTSGPDSFVRVNNVENTIANTYELFSYTNPYVNGAVSNIELVSITSTAKGIVKENSNTEFLRVKRITFENTFQEGINVIGDISGASAEVVSVSQDFDEIYPIGLNADIAANVVTANGQIASLKIVDSGIGYGNGEVVQVTSEDNLRSATVKLIIDGHGVGKGYYRSSKGFLSSDMYIHDGDYYQEYSYEIFSKLSVDRYSDMFKKVMHTAGTKFFGSASVTEEDSLPVTVPEIATGLEIEFDAQDDVNSGTERIQVDIEAKRRYINPVNVNAGNEFISIVNNPFSNDDYVRYNLSAGNTQISGLTQNGYYYVVQANSSGLKLSTTANGTPQNLTGGASEWGHELVSYVNPLSNGDVVVYRTSAGKTPVTNLTNNQIYYVMNTNPISVQLSTTSTGSPINITAAVSSEIGHYLIKIVEEN